MKRSETYGPLIAAAVRVSSAAHGFDRAVSEADPDQYLRFAAWLKLENRMLEAKGAFSQWMAAQPDPKREEPHAD